MSRSTQYIGLNKKAHTFITEHSAKIISEKQPNVVRGMYDDEIELGTWEVIIKKTSRVFGNPPEKQKFIIREAVQAVPWSSGPMIFTCLEIDFDPEGEGEKFKCFEWISDPTLQEREDFPEFDYDEGTYWV